MKIVYKNIVGSLLFLVLFVSCGPSEEEIQNRIDNAVEEAIDTSTTTTSTKPTTTTTTVYDSTCLDYANDLINIWPVAEAAVANVFDVYSQLGDGNLSYSQGANKLFEADLELNKVTREFRSLNPNQENKRFHNKMLEVFEYILESNQFGIQGLDEIDPDILGRAVSLAEIGVVTMEEAVDLLPMGTIYGLRDEC